MRSWNHSMARCRGAPPDMFFEDTPSNERAAKEMCSKCPVRAGCLEDAMDATVELMLDGDDQLDSGVFGGLNPAERQDEARRTGRA